MSDFDANEFLSDIPEDGQPTQGGVLRKKLEQALALLAEKDRVISGFRDEKIKTEVSEAWGIVPEKFRGLYNGDPKDPKAISSWIEAASALGVIPAGEQKPGSKPAEDHPDTAALKQFSEAANLGSGTGSDGTAGFVAKGKELSTKSAFGNPNAMAELFAMKPQ